MTIESLNRGKKKQHIEPIFINMPKIMTDTYPENEMPLSKFVQLYGNILFDNQESDEEKDKKLDELYNNLENFMDKVK